MYKRTGCLSCGALKDKLTHLCEKKMCPKTLGSYFRWALDLPMQTISGENADTVKNLPESAPFMVLSSQEISEP